MNNQVPAFYTLHSIFSRGNTFGANNSFLNTHLLLFGATVRRPTVRLWSSVSLSCFGGGVATLERKLVAADIYLLPAAGNIARWFVGELVMRLAKTAWILITNGSGVGKGDR